MEHQVEVACGELGVGATEVPYPQQNIELVRVAGWHGYPHIRQHEEPDKSYVQVQGAMPDSSVTVIFNVEGE